jgi:hypothetical protein
MSDYPGLLSDRLKIGIYVKPEKLNFRALQFSKKALPFNSLCSCTSSTPFLKRL